MLQLPLKAASHFRHRRNAENKNSCLFSFPMALAPAQRQELPFWNSPSPCNFIFGRGKKKFFPCTWWEWSKISPCCTYTNIKLGQRITFSSSSGKDTWDKTTSIQMQCDLLLLCRQEILGHTMALWISHPCSAIGKNLQTKDCNKDNEKCEMVIYIESLREKIT